ncbi:MAG: VOC family protein [Xanthomonadaceae bacterium]|nr:VOC family protein [Xanthomonadaceae bacterium]
MAPLVETTMQDSVPFRPLQAVPILRIFDLAKAREFYLDFLGFTLDWEHHFDDVAPRYLQVSFGDLVLHLSEHYGDACPGSTVFVRVEGLRDYHRELTAKGYGYLRPGLEETGHGSLGMQVTDPFGNRLRFDEALPDPVDATTDA